MSKLSVRVVLSVLISLGVIFALYTSVQSASLFSDHSAGSRALGGAAVNFNHDRYTAVEQEIYNTQLDAYYESTKDGGGGHECESELRDSPDL